MAKLVKKRSRRAGLFSTRSYRREKGWGDYLTRIGYDEANLKESEVKTAEECFSF